MHGVVTHVIDREGRWRANFHGLRFKATNLVVHVNALANDVHGPGEKSERERSFWGRVWSLF
jgi:protein SCO1/2